MPNIRILISTINSDRLSLDSFSVIDDENTNVVTAGAIVTVTVTLVRSNLGELFGNSDVAEKQGIA